MVKLGAGDRFPEILMRSGKLLINYSCNLPSNLDERDGVQTGVNLPDILLDDKGLMRPEIAPESAIAFQRLSLAGGETALNDNIGQHLTLQFRWICVSAHWTIGAVWRLYSRLSMLSNRDFGRWLWTGHDYLFDADNARADDWTAGPIPVDCGEPHNRLYVTLNHDPEGLLQLPDRYGLVKIFNLKSRNC